MKKCFIICLIVIIVLLIVSYVSFVLGSMFFPCSYLRVVRPIYKLVGLSMIIIPAVFVAYSVDELIKAVFSKEKEAIEKAKKELFNGVIYAVVIFVVPLVIGFAIDKALDVVEVDVTPWERCWKSMEDE